MMSLKVYLNVLEKTKKCIKLFPFQKKRKLQKLIKIVMKLLQLYRIKKIIDIARFMAISSSNLADNLTEGIHKIKSKD